MNAKKFRDYQPHQLMILPPALDEWLPEDHPVHFISQVVDQLDLSAIYNDYTERRGQPPYEPRMMVKVWLYAYMRGIRSSRRLERALYEDVGFRVLSANQQPDHWALANFRRRHHEALARLFVQWSAWPSRRVTVDAETHVIVAADPTNQAADAPPFVRQLEQLAKLLRVHGVRGFRHFRPNYRQQPGLCSFIHTGY